MARPLEAAPTGCQRIRQLQLAPVLRRVFPEHYIRRCIAPDGVRRLADEIVVDFPQNRGGTMSAFSWPQFAILWGAAVIEIACVTPYTLELTADAINKAQARIHQPRWVLVLLQSAQSVVLMGVATGLGLLIAPRIGLGAPLLEGLLAGKDVTTQALAMIAPALLLGIGTSAVVLALEITVFWPRLPQIMRDTFPIPALWKRLLAGVYGGIDEEILLRLFLLSLLAWLISFFWPLPGRPPALGALSPPHHPPALFFCPLQPP